MKNLMGVSIKKMALFGVLQILTAPVAFSEEPKEIEELRVQKENVLKKEKELQAKEAELQAREKALDEKIVELKKLREEMDQKEAAELQSKEEQVNKVVETLEKMSPVASAQLLSTLDERLAVAVLGKLSTQKLAKTMAKMNPDKSARLSELYSGLKPKNKKGGEKDGNDQLKSNSAERGSPRSEGQKTAAAGQ